MVSVKKRKMILLEKLEISSLKKICRIENISSEGTKEELVERVAKHLYLAPTRLYVKRLGLNEEISLFNHDLVPTHRILEDDERKKLFKKYSITPKNLPRLKVRDPAAMTIGARRGDIVEISRKSKTAGEIKYYRVVVR